MQSRQPAPAMFFRYAIVSQSVPHSTIIKMVLKIPIYYPCIIINHCIMRLHIASEYNATLIINNLLYKTITIYFTEIAVEFTNIALLYNYQN